MASDTRDRILAATAELFRRHGYTGTGLKQIVAAAKAPFGSIYHHFPGGKEQLGVEVVRASGAMYWELFPLIMDAADGDLVAGIELFFAGAAATLEETDFADACPIGTVALEVASTNEPLREATADVFASWVDGAAERFVAEGMAVERARPAAIAVIAALEGAFMLSRAAKSTEPMEAAGAVAAAAVRDALGASA